MASRGGEDGDCDYVREAQSRVARGEDFDSAWRSAVWQSAAPLGAQDRELVSQVGDILGASDLETQRGQLALLKERLRARLDEARNSAQTGASSAHAGNASRPGLRGVFDVNRQDGGEYGGRGFDLSHRGGRHYRIGAQPGPYSLGAEEQAMLTTLAGLIVVLMMMIYRINELFETVKTVFNL